MLMGKRELFALLSLYFWCLVIAVWLFLAVLWVSLQFVIVVFPDHTRTHLLFFMFCLQSYQGLIIDKSLVGIGLIHK